ncbi:MAG: flagellar biosynthetic protein FliP, partial [Pseudoalteromonas sp.]
MMKWLLILISLVFIPTVNAEGIEALNITTNPDGSQDYSVTLQVLAIMTALSFIPAAVIMMTSFTRIIVVLAILRQAIGLQQTPSNQILLGMSLFLSIFIMAPVYQKVNEQAIEPYMNEQVTSIQALELAKEPM